MSEDKKIKTTSCRKRIARKIQPKQFESVDISVECEDEVEWTTIEERDEKLKKLTELLILEFEDTFNKVCEELEVEDKKAFGKKYSLGNNSSQSNDSNKPNKKNNNNDDDDDSLDLDSFADTL